MPLGIVSNKTIGCTFYLPVAYRKHPVYRTISDVGDDGIGQYEINKDHELEQTAGNLFLKYTPSMT